MSVCKWKRYFIPLIITVALSNAQADQVSDAASRLDALLPAVRGSITDSNQATQAIVLLRAIAVMNVTMSSSQMAIAAPVVFHATLVNSTPDNQVPKEAKITMAALGYGTDNLSAFVDSIVSTTEIKFRQALLSVIDEQTKTARSNLRNIGIVKLADFYVQQVRACQHDALGPTSSRAVYPPSGSVGAVPDVLLTDLVFMPEVSDLTDNEKFAGVLAAESLECISGNGTEIQHAYLLVHGAERKRLFMDKLTSSLADLKSAVGDGGGWNVRFFLLNEMSIDFMTSLLIGNSSGGSSPNTSWDEVATFSAADRNYLTAAMIKNIGDELDLDMTSVVMWGGRLKVFVNGVIGTNATRLFSFIPSLGISAKSLLLHMEPFLTVSGENIPVYRTTIDQVKSF